ncbi:hypothetical protein SNEBB_006093 [Seison nebaliae]|nr:hypothetical protein SNEBB_006093 [Seison nebaliae]
MKNCLLIVSVIDLLLIQWIDAHCQLNLIRRSEWNAKSPKSVKRRNSMVQNVFIEKCGKCCCMTKMKCLSKIGSLQMIDMNSRLADDIRYNFILGNENRIYEGRGWNAQGQYGYEHIRNVTNKNSIGFCIMGNMDDVTKSVMVNINDLIHCAIDKKVLSPNFGFWTFSQQLDKFILNMKQQPSRTKFSDELHKYSSLFPNMDDNGKPFHSSPVDENYMGDLMDDLKEDKQHKYINYYY